MKNVFIWMLAILLAIVIWPVVVIIFGWLIHASLTIGLVLLLAILIKRVIDGPR
jgi:hypothetical protein